ncbi:MAG: RluA family pseudouridine synthase [Nitrospirae bacterium]|nr:RluA family pseudouridine synthase [Nitrospirota bacterium]MBF0535509.1 RluA family pseudouridine synthase [Nitrospirota bacterium]MBF0617359.1 RluA family pseudouridine synthase [Nitrospirota bacterium]
MEHCFTIEPADAGERLDVFLVKKTGLTRSKISKLSGLDAVMVNDVAVKCGYSLRAGEMVTVSDASSDETEQLIPEDICIDIVYQDNHVVVVNKPPDMPMYPGAGHSSGTLMNALAMKVKTHATVGAPLRPGVVHRIDKDTSGLVVVALDDESYYALAEQFKNKEVIRSYKALIYGKFKENAGVVTLPVGRSTTDRKKMSTRSRYPRAAVTNWRVLRQYAGATLIEARLSTGRTHQIRVHFSALGHPLLGDTCYGNKDSIRIKGITVAIPRQMLHAAQLGFIHPVTKKLLEFESEIPADMASVLDLFEQ